ncbi:MAG TPA: hypothetical protein VG815_09250 [Chloroflexota bacterium]|jgi:hypothetical protein|nr:hypothetical protein [Chloroflexota bacterium]
MRIVIRSLVVLVAAAVGIIGSTPVHGAALTCKATKYFEDGGFLTARMINPATAVSGDVNAKGCDIGVYFGPKSKGAVSQADIHGATYYGVLNNGGTVSLTDSAVHDIGDDPFDGASHGRGVMTVAPKPQTASMTLSDDTIYRFQWSGVVFRGPGVTGHIGSSSVLGFGPTDFTTQYGIRFQNGATGSATDNYVSGFSYTGSEEYVVSGISAEGGCGQLLSKKVIISHNLIEGSDIGINLSNGNAACTAAPSVATADVASHNTIIDDAVTNVDGCVVAYGCTECKKTQTVCPYQAGISDFGNADQMNFNRIIGVGYTPVSSPPPVLVCIDTSINASGIHAVVQHNTCPKA